MAKKQSPDKLEAVKKDYDYLGLYILQCLELRALASRRLKFEVSNGVLSKVGEEIMLGKRHDNNGIDAIRGVISLAKKSGYLQIISEKDKNYLFFPHLKIGDKKSVLRGKKVVRGADGSRARPKDIATVAEYMISLLPSGKYPTINTENVRDEADKFFKHWAEFEWHRKGGKIRNWKMTAVKWMENKTTWDDERRKSSNNTSSGAMAL